MALIRHEVLRATIMARRVNTLAGRVKRVDGTTNKHRAEINEAKRNEKVLTFPLFFFFFFFMHSSHHVLFSIFVVIIILFSVESS